MERSSKAVKSSPDDADAYGVARLVDGQGAHCVHAAVVRLVDIAIAVCSVQIIHIAVPDALEGAMIDLEAGMSEVIVACAIELGRHVGCSHELHDRVMNVDVGLTFLCNPLPTNSSLVVVLGEVEHDEVVTGIA